ncbi:2'-5' RNA ligase family protein [Aliidongia dinghuensis]|nr:2'-5' RNA ligase family protein [Aliidongia dinghuensis]
MLAVKHRPEQLWLPGLGGDPTDGLFFALLPEPSAARRTTEIADRLRGLHGLKGSPLAADRFHVSLHNLGAYAGPPPEEVVARACAAAASVVAEPFGVLFDRAGSFIGRKAKLPFVLRSDEPLLPLMAFYQTLGEALARHGLGRWVQRSFTPHLTLLYDARYVDTSAVEPVRWTVHEFVLIRSRLGKTVHIPLGRWSLRGGATD